MKIVNFTPGLGNQIFEYIFSEYLRKKYPNSKVYGYYNPKFLNEKHNGLEVDKIFNIILPKSSLLSDFVAFMCRILSRIYPPLKANDIHYSENAIYFDSWWQNKRFFLDTPSKISFREVQLNEINRKLVHNITSSDAVSIHVRRGDYLEPQFAKRYGGICTIEYYLKAIDIINGIYPHSQFYVFSNDIDWCKNNLTIENVVYVTNNKGTNSWLDMYLMSLCKANIIANSSFSYWGAMLNKNKNLVVYPGKWFNTHTPDIFPNEWIAL